jgi:dTDP-3-amino-3,4,6-trideoxy-alpha-D-glucose transaminase
MTSGWPSSRVRVNVPFLDLRREVDYLGTELLDAAERVIRSGSYVLGQEVGLFEQEFASFTRTKNCVTVGNGLHALELVLRAWGIGEGDEVLVPANTFIATWLAVSACGAIPVPIDPDPGTLTIEARDVAARVTGDTAAVIPVHLFGMPNDVPAIRRSLEGRSVRILEDAAQAHGACVGGAPVGGLGDAAAFSFYPSKNLGALGDGGAVTTNDSRVAESLRLLRNYGSSVKYRHEIRGGNSRLDELQAALLRVKLSHVEESNRLRAECARGYLDALADVPGISLPAPPPGDRSQVWYVFNIRHQRRDELRSMLEREGIGTTIYYPEPPHLSPAYAELGYARGDFPVAEKFAGTSLALPFGPHLRVDEQETVVDSVRRASLALS